MASLLSLLRGAAASIAATIGFWCLPATARVGAGALLRQCASKSASSLGGTLIQPMISPAALKTLNRVTAEWLGVVDFSSLKCFMEL